MDGFPWTPGSLHSPAVSVESVRQEDEGITNDLEQRDNPVILWKKRRSHG